MTEGPLDPPPEPPRPKAKGCLFGLLATVAIFAAALFTLWFMRIEIGGWAMHRGIEARPWSEPLRQRAHDLLDRHLEVYRADRIGPDEQERLQPLLDAFDEAEEDEEVSEEEAAALLDLWESWLDGLEEGR